VNSDRHSIAVPLGTDILAALSRHIITGAADLPDLTGVTVLLPDLQFAPRLRRHLLQAAHRQGHTALLGPDITTLDHAHAASCCWWRC